jgi:CelD/BcsL family acetyltransferase involved in cellulose biosynthesis
VLSHHGATVFHSQGWARVLAESYGYSPEYLLAEDGGSLRALLPLFEVRSWITGKRGVSLPFTDRCDPLLSDRIAFPDVLAGGRSLGEKRGWKYIEWRGAPDTVELSATFYQHDLDLTPSEASLFDRCAPARRRAIRKAEKEQILVERSGKPEAMEAFYRLHQLTRRKHGIPPQPIRFFRNIYRCLIERGRGTVSLAVLNGKAVASAIFLNFGASAIYKFGASDPGFQALRPNNLLLWDGILQMKRAGARALSFGRTSMSQDGLRRFKMSFGASESMLRYLRYDFRANAFVSGQVDRSTGLHATLFRFCPRFLSRMAGAAIYPHIG